VAALAGLALLAHGGVGGAIVEALLWGPGRAETWRRATLVRNGAVLELSADVDPGRAPAGPVQGWLHEPDPAVIRSGLVSLVAFKLIDLTIGLRVTEEQEREGLDTVSHGERAYNG